MSKQFWIFLLVGLAVVGASIWGIFYMQRGAHLEAKGKILKVRILPLDENSAVLVTDFRVENLSDVLYSLRGVDVSVEKEDGTVADGAVSAKVDLERLFQAFPIVGIKYNDNFTMRDKIGPRQSIDRMIGARFDLSEPQMQKRKAVRLRLEEVDGLVTELREERGANR